MFGERVDLGTRLQRRHLGARAGKLSSSRSTSATSRIARDRAGRCGTFSPSKDARVRGSVAGAGQSSGLICLRCRCLAFGILPLESRAARIDAARGSENHPNGSPLRALTFREFVTMSDGKTVAKSAQTAVKHSAKVVEQHSKEIADSAKEIKSSSVAIETSADRTTQLAADRTILAAERTYAAWVRTGLFALASGIGARALLTGWSRNGSSWRTAVCWFCSACSASAPQAGGNFIPEPPPPTPDVKPIPHGLLATVNVFLALVSVVALIGIWTHTPR